MRKAIVSAVARPGERKHSAPVFQAFFNTASDLPPSAINPLIPDYSRTFEKDA